MSAGRAPAAFQCGPEVKPSNWLVVYRGVVTPPKSGTYRFVGADFQAVAGTSYPIEILISESGGNLFCASLLIEEKGETYPKASGGSPILPLFRLDDSVPPPSDADNSPPYDPAGPVWKLVPGSRKLDI